MKISVVIPTSGNPETLKEAITAILDNSVLPEEIIVVDQSIDETTKLIVESFSSGLLRYIRDTGTGVSRARNIGWQSACGEIISFTDDDARVDKKWIESIMESFTKFGDRVGVCGGKIIAVYESRNPEWSIPERWKTILPSYDQGDETGDFFGNSLPAGVNLSTKKEILVKLNGFNERLGTDTAKKINLSGEDSDFTKRVKREKLRLLYNPECRVYHPVPLHRQNQAFLNRRMFTEGVTYAYSKLLKTHFVRLRSAFSIICCFGWFFKYPLWKLFRDPRISEGLKNYYKGRISGNYSYGIIKNE